jgi:CDP-diacylglycerol--glycerol-3-phosphate 3-phosphatidyltransferase
MNLPNKLTLLRILLIPVFIVLVCLPNLAPAYLLAFVVFTAASITDYLDGHIARKNNMVTDFGKFADPLADKILTTTAFIYMMRDGVCPPLVLAIIIVREFAVSGVRMVAVGSSEGKVIAANMWGKLKTVMQMVTISIYYFLAGVQHLLPLHMEAGYWPQLITVILCWVVALLTAVSGLVYIWQNRQFINTAK